MHKDDSFTKLFPTATLANEESMLTDSDLAAYAVSARTAFQSEWLKKRGSRMRHVDLRQHPERESESTAHRKARDHVVQYREAMLRLRPLVTGESRVLLS